ncbi:MAG TPA: TetR family transcriptional regulator [Pseudonocardiaceae bacterium]|nr:TetR family transcriptional regulator [Pseudonocardiaceae bacterium]
MASTQRSGSFIEQARRTQIVDCAVETLAEIGYGNTSLAAIAKRAGISKGVISYHFAGKDELMQQVLTESMALAAAEMVPRIEAGEGPIGRMRGHIEGNIAFIKAHPKHLVAMVEILNNAKDDTGAHLVDVSEFANLVGMVAHAFAAAQESGQLREFDPLVMAQTLRSAIDGMVAQYLTNPSLDLDAYGAELVTIFELATQKL